MHNVPELGKLIEGTAFRDAVHVAVAPVEAGEIVHPGDRVWLRDDGTVSISTVGDHKAVGVVDPFLEEATAVPKGAKFWLFLFPGTVTSLRHSWTHPAFKAKIPGKE